MTTINSERIDQILAEADQLSRRGSLDGQPAALFDQIEYLYSQKFRTYVAVLGVTLVARCLGPHLNVRRVQAGDSSDGYSAAAIGKKLIPFTTEQGIDLRTTSSQIMNSQPFTHIREITRTLRPTDEYRRFYEAVEQVQSLTPDEALTNLAVVFRMGRERRRAQGGLVLKDEVVNPYEFLATVCEVVAAFVDENSDGGKTGQALGAALCDLVFGYDHVTMPKINDPGFGVPGDFRAGDNGSWLAGESKQKPVTTGDVTSFLSTAADRGIWRAAYLALANKKYPRNIDEGRVHNTVGHQLEFNIYTSSADAIAGFLHLAPGSARQLAEEFAERFLQRLIEIDVEPTTLVHYRTVIAEVGFA